MNVLHQFTRKTLLQNRARTIVTIVGIILSVSMITAVTTFVSSLQAFLIDTVERTDGKWHGAVYDVTSDKKAQAQASADVKSIGASQTVGYAKLKNAENEYKPYLYVEGIDAGFLDLMPVTVTSGRMPETEEEILLPEHLASNGGVQHALGDVLKLDLGERTASNGETLNQQNSYSPESLPETLMPKAQKRYTVVGFYERPSFEDMSAPGYTALTRANPEAANGWNLYIRMKNPKQMEPFMQDMFPMDAVQYNGDLLRFLGASNDMSYNSVLYSMGGILIVIIMAASVLLIYNAFFISVSERTRQFGLLSSVGATKRQMKQSVLYEALVLSAIGIPLGVLAGIAGIGITLKLVEGLFAVSFFAASKATFHLFVSFPAVLAAVAVGLVTILLSAYWPSKRAVRFSAIDAIRQSADIKIKSRQVRISKLTHRLFGFEGMLARKNFKRNKRKYRTTVISLFVSIVLFVSASSFCAYLSRSVDAVVYDASYDIQYDYTPDLEEKVPFETLYRELLGAKNIVKGGYLTNMAIELRVPSRMLSDDFRAFQKKHMDEADLALEGDTLTVYAQAFFVDDQTYQMYLEDNGYDVDVYMNAQNPVAVALSFQKIYQAEEGKYYTFQMLNDQDMSVEHAYPKELAGYYFAGQTYDENGSDFYEYQKEDGTGDVLRLTREEALESKTLHIGAVSDQKLFGADWPYGSQTCIFYPYSAMEAVMGEDAKRSEPITMVFQSNHHKETYGEQIKVLNKYHLAEGRLYDLSSALETNRALVTIVNVFAYGFIILISLIAAANVFNTISTNLRLRTREFAILKSVGMGEKGINRMMRYECLLYGVKGLLFGLPVSIFVTYLIYRSISQGLDTRFFVPVSSIVIAVASVFLVVFATMLYARNKLKQENMIDILKTETI
ncbi:MAG: ABC transporter permease [Oscillospiraceae bacterium]|jgi:putative ABC transport system permease protein